MKNKNILLKATFVAVLFASATACADAPKEKENKQKKEATEVETETMEVEDENESFLLPSPIQIAAIFNRAGLAYESDLVNPTSNISKYNTKTAKYLNFGVYSADLAYVVLNRQQQESIDYLNAVKSLSEDIGMPSIFGSGKLIKSFEKNINNQDTALAILTKIKSKTDQYLAENNEQSKEAVFFASAWIEGMYLGANSSSDMSKVTPRLLEQMTILENIIKAVKTQKDASLNLDFLISGLEDLQSTFEGFKEVKSLEDPDLDIDDIKLTSEELVTLTKKITELRNKIING